MSENINRRDFIKKGVLLTGGLIIPSLGCSGSDPVENSSPGGGSNVASRFIIVGDQGDVWRSFDGSSWINIDSFKRYDLNGVIYANNLFVAVGGASGGGRIQYSLDGDYWSSSFSTVYQLNAITYGNGRFVTVGDNGDTYYSDDGVSWTGSISVGTFDFLMGVAYGNNLFIAVSNTGNIYHSSDGTNWTINAIGGGVYAIAFANGQFVAVGASGGAYWCTDGTDWSGDVGPGVPGNLRGIAYGNGRFVAVGPSGGAYWSIDGTGWSGDVGPGMSGNLHGIAYGNGRFVTVGDGRRRRVDWSVDGTIWTDSSSVGANNLNGITYG